MTRRCWPHRAVRNRHLHAIEQASRRWRQGATRPKSSDFTQVPRPPLDFDAVWLARLSRARARGDTRRGRFFAPVSRAATSANAATSAGRLRLRTGLSQHAVVGLLRGRRLGRGPGRWAAHCAGIVLVCTGGVAVDRRRLQMAARYGIRPRQAREHAARVYSDHPNDAGRAAPPGARGRRATLGSSTQFLPY